MKFIVGEYEYEFTRAGMSVGDGYAMFDIHIDNPEVNAETLYSQISPIVHEGFSLETGQSGHTYLGYSVDTIRENFSEEEPSVTMTINLRKDIN